MTWSRESARLSIVYSVVPAFFPVAASRRSPLSTLSSVGAPSRQLFFSSLISWPLGKQLILHYGHLLFKFVLYIKT